MSTSDLLCFVCVEEMHATVLSQQKEESDKLQSEVEMKQRLESQMEMHREQHQKQLSVLREEIADKQVVIDNLKELVVQCLAFIEIHHLITRGAVNNRYSQRVSSLIEIRH